ncbi:hypothetical protein IID20_04245 [Patescibacteria group bacterium]|nr:hypothetical protein [Patescibacteria group bacterium]
MIKFFGLRNNSKPKVLEPVKEPQKDMETLIEEYRVETFLLSPLAQKYMGNVPESELKSLRRIEEQIIELLPDKFQRDIFTIFARHGFNIVDFLKKENWQEDLHTTYRNICHFLYWCTTYPRESEFGPLLPFPGNEFFFWLLKQAKKSKDSDDDIGNILNTFIGTSEILGHRLSKEEKERIGNPLITVFAGEWRKQSLVLIDILHEVKGGEAFIQGLLGLKK